VGTEVSFFAQYCGEACGSQDEFEPDVNGTAMVSKLNEQLYHEVNDGTQSIGFACRNYNEPIAY
jgi:glutathionyl-hydroquinone reductase